MIDKTYLNILKRSLTDSIHKNPHLKQKFIDNPTSLTSEENDLIVNSPPFTDTIYGKGFPPNAETLIGLKRLDNIQHCIEDIISNNIKGDLIETGVWRGGATIFMRACLKHYGITNKTVYCSDSFEGLPKPHHKYPHDNGNDLHAMDYLKVSEDQVKQNFEKYGLFDDQVKFIKGFFETSLDNPPFEKLSLLRLDGDMYSSTWQVLEKLYDKVSIGGYVIIDDYGCYDYCKKAVDDFRSKFGITETIIPIDWTGVYWKKTKNIPPPFSKEGDTGGGLPSEALFNNTTYQKGLISVFTPFHQLDTKFLQQAYQSLKNQTYKNWEWVILLNGKAKAMADNQFVNEKDAELFFELSDNNRVKIFVSDQAGNIGALKKQANSKCSGEICVELDYDDMLVETCLQEIHDAFSDEKIQFAYSNCAEVSIENTPSTEEDGEGGEAWIPYFYAEQFGWINREFQWHGHSLVESVAWPPSAQMMRRVEWAPNHVRSWRKTAYDKIGGHDASLTVGDDHDLCCRFYREYGAEGFKHIDKCLYIYRVHPGNNVKLQNVAIQTQVEQNYIKHSRGLAERWAKDNNIRIIDLGGRFNCEPGHESVDLQDADVICDLNEKWPFEDNSVGVIRASHILEHLKNPIHCMNEAFRVLAGGGWFFIDVPSTDGRGAWQDPTHISFFNSNSFFYYTRASHAQYIQGKNVNPSYNGRFQVSRIINYFPNAFFETHNIPCVQADLICLKEPYSLRACGEVLI